MLANQHGVRQADVVRSDRAQSDMEDVS